MSLADRLINDLREAMRAGDTTRRDAIRLIRSALQAEEVRRREQAHDAWTKAGANPETDTFTPPPPMTDAEMEQVLQRQAKQRRDSIEAYRKAGRADLAAKEQAELDVIQSYLPRPLSHEEIAALAREAIAEVGAEGPKQMGAVMRVLMPRVGSRAEGREVSAVVSELLGGQR